MAPYYKIITAAASGGLPLEQTLLDEMDKANQEELKRLDERLEEAEKIEGESEISDALRAKANYLTRIGDKVCQLFSTLLLLSLMSTTWSRLGSRNCSAKTCT
jgi:26S proteasome regulatory subunit N7